MVRVREGKEKIMNSDDIRTKDNYLTGSEAIFGFCGWLTSRSEITVMSSNHECFSIIKLIKAFCEENKLVDPRENYTNYVNIPERELNEKS